jgi:hypothetical protein
VKRNARIDRPGALFGETILLEPAVVAGEIHTKDLIATGAEHGSVSPFERMPALPAVIEPVAGTQPVVVQATAPMPPLPAGHYGRVRIENGATLRLSGGVYEIESLTLGGHSRLEALAPSDVRIAATLATAESAYIGPGPQEAPVALNISIEVNGINGNGGKLDEHPRAVVVGAQNNLAAVLVVPNGTLQLGAGT